MLLRPLPRGSGAAGARDLKHVPEVFFASQRAPLGTHEPRKTVVQHGCRYLHQNSALLPVPHRACAEGFHSGEIHSLHVPRRLFAQPAIAIDRLYWRVRRTISGSRTPLLQHASIYVRYYRFQPSSREDSFGDPYNIHNVHAHEDMKWTNPPSIASQNGQTLNKPLQNSKIPKVARCQGGWELPTNQKS